MNEGGWYRFGDHFNDLSEDKFVARVNRISDFDLCSRDDSVGIDDGLEAGQDDKELSRQVFPTLSLSINGRDEHLNRRAYNHHGHDHPSIAVLPLRRESRDSKYVRSNVKHAKQSSQPDLPS